jgi:catechol 2,3-dioxygenase-like lactoylglutathione lyase family enzyme
MARNIDHIVIAVRDLAAASNDFATAGFTVTPGGEHASGGTHNALVTFDDGAYFELIAFKESDQPQDHRWWTKLRNGEGTVDFALGSDDLAADAARLRQAGVTVDGPRDGGRVRPDGQRLAWRTIGLEADDIPLPFVIDDDSPRDRRVPTGPAARHPLGVSGVAGLRVLVPDLDRAAPLYQALLGAPGAATAPTIDGVRRARRFPLGAQWIELLEPAPDAAALQRHLRDRGAAPYEIVLVGTGSATLPEAQTHAARVRIEPGGVADR